MKEPVPLGELTESTQRDAIHIAILPAVAEEKLSPGQDVAILNNGNAVAHGEHIGIVDPFLKSRVFPGDRFYVCLYPNTITSLRHEWEHPAMTPATPKPPTQQQSKEWLAKFADDNDLPGGYEFVVAAATNKHFPPFFEEYGDCAYRNNGDYIVIQGRDGYAEIPDEFWDHIENVTGEKVAKSDRPESFSCSC